MEKVSKIEKSKEKLLKEGKNKGYITADMLQDIFEDVTIKPEEKDKIYKFLKEKYKENNKYDKASKMIIYFMIRNNDLIEYYFNNLSFLPNEIDNLLANQIVLFYKKYKSFNVRDFITYLEDKKDLINRLIQIDELNYKFNFSKEEIDSYFISIKEYIKNKQIDELKKKLKSETNEVVKRDLVKKIFDLKIKGV